MSSLRTILLRLVFASLLAIAAFHNPAYAQATQQECNWYCRGQCDGLCAAYGMTCSWVISTWNGPGSCDCAGECA